MISYRQIKIYLLIIGFLFPLLAAGSSPPSIESAKKPTLYDVYSWSVMYYYGITLNNSLRHIVAFSGLKRWPENIQSLELAHTLSEENFLRRFLNPIVGVVEVAGNITVRTGKNQPTIYEFDPYLIFRWANLPWNHYVNTSLALAEGVSYTSSVPAIEQKNNNNTKRLLNYLMFEATFALPKYPQFQLVARIHHRSGAYGLYHAGNTGSNDVGVGVRYLFD